MQETPTPPEPGEGNTDESSSLEQHPVLVLTLTRGPLDYLIRTMGFVPNEELRLTIARALNAQAPAWIRSIAEHSMRRIATTN